MIMMDTWRILAIILPVLFAFIIGFSIIAYIVYKRKKSCLRVRNINCSENDTNRVVSVNPGYAELVDIPQLCEVPRKNVKILEELRSGQFGKVYKGILVHANENGDEKKVKVECAVKVLGENSTSEDCNRFLEEASVMTKLKCHHIVRLFGVVSLSRPTLVIMELMANGDLETYLKSKRPRPEEGAVGDPPSLQESLKMACEIGDGLAYLEYHKYVHRDVASRNCLISADFTVKVGDFGMTEYVMFNDYYQKRTAKLPIRWMAPESLRSGIFSVQSDVWSFGILLWEIATVAARPYDDLTSDQVIRFVRGGGSLERPENCPEILFSIMVSCWQQIPKERPTFAQILDLLLPKLELSSVHAFSQVSFYHSTDGIKYRSSFPANRQDSLVDDEEISAETPLNEL